MDIYIDCEWDGWQGDLISIALCAEDGSEFYEVIKGEYNDKWVIDNVIPVLNKEQKHISEVKVRLGEYLNLFDSVNIIADWPEDISHFCKLLIVYAGHRLNTPKLSMQIIRNDTESKIPHNALSDSRALREFVMNNKEEIKWR